MHDSVDLDQLFRERVVIDEALQRAAYAARQQYVRLNRAMPVWSNGRLEWVPPAELEHELAQSGGSAETLAREPYS